MLDFLLVGDKQAEQAAAYGNEKIYKGIKKWYTNPHIIWGPASTTGFVGWSCFLWAHCPKGKDWGEYHGWILPDQFGRVFEATRFDENHHRLEIKDRSLAIIIKWVQVNFVIMNGELLDSEPFYKDQFANLIQKSRVR